MTTWVAVTGTCIGTIPEKNAGTSGIGTETVAVIVMRPAGRQHGWASQRMVMTPRSLNPWSAKASPAAYSARGQA